MDRSVPASSVGHLEEGSGASPTQSQSVLRPVWKPLVDQRQAGVVVAG